MITMNSISGGQTSAYLAAHYPADYNVFALVRTNNLNCKFPDTKIRQVVSDRIEAEFIGTLEFDEIIYTILDLEQYLGKSIKWVTGVPFEDLIKAKGMHLPNRTRRFCTERLKIDPIFKFWSSLNIDPWEARLGFRANETRRIINQRKSLTSGGFQTYKRICGIWEKGTNKGKNKWELVKWQKPVYPLHDIMPTWKDEIQSFWVGKKVRFAPVNNCVGCFHKSPVNLKLMSELAPNKFNWFKNMEEDVLNVGDRMTWKFGLKYSDIQKLNFSAQINFSDLGECDSGYCGL